MHYRLTGVYCTCTVYTDVVYIYDIIYECKTGRIRVLPLVTVKYKVISLQKNIRNIYKYFCFHCTIHLAQCIPSSFNIQNKHIIKLSLTGFGPATFSAINFFVYCYLDCDYI